MTTVVAKKIGRGKTPQPTKEKRGELCSISVAQSPQVVKERAGALAQRGIARAALAAGWGEDVNYWVYDVVDPIRGGKRRRAKAKPGVEGQKYVWGPKEGNHPTYYLPQGIEVFKRAIAEAGGHVHYVNGEPALLTMLEAGIPNAICWFGESSVPRTLGEDMAALGVRRATVWPDYDETGVLAARKVVDSCSSCGILCTAKDHGIHVDKADLNDAWIADAFDDVRFRARLMTAREIELPKPVEPNRPTHRLDIVYGDAKQRIIEDVLRYIEMYADGVKRPTASGWVNHRSIIRHDDHHASAGFNIYSGAYHDFGGKTLSLWDIARVCGIDPESYYVGRREARAQKERRRSAWHEFVRQVQPQAESERPADKGESDAEDDEAVADHNVSEQGLGLFWVRPAWQFEHRLLVIAGGTQLAQIVARVRDVVQRKVMRASFIKADFARACAISPSKVKKYIDALDGYLWCSNDGGKTYQLISQPNFQRLRDDLVIPRIMARCYEKALAPIGHWLADVAGLDDDAAEWHDREANLYKQGIGRASQDARAYAAMMRSIDAPTAPFRLPDPWMDYTAYRYALVYACDVEYYARHEDAIEASVTKRQKDLDVMVMGASNRYVAVQTGMHWRSVLEAHKAMTEAGALQRFENRKVLVYTVEDDFLRCSKDVLRARIAQLPRDHHGKAISVSWEGAKGIGRASIVDGVADWVLDELARADRVTVRIDQPAAYHPGHESFDVVREKREGQASDERATQKVGTAAAKPFPSPETPQTTNGRQGRMRSKKRCSPETLKRIKASLAAKANPLAWDAQFILRQLIIGYETATGAIKRSYANVLGIRCEERVIDIPF